MQYKITIPETPTSLNVLLRLHWAARKRIKAMFNRAVWAGVHQSNLPKNFQENPKKVHIDITIYVANSRGRVGDGDNFLKHCLDSLKDNGVICDDDQNWLSWSQPVINRDPGNPRTEVIVREM